MQLTVRVTRKNMPADLKKKTVKGTTAAQYDSIKMER